MSAEHMRLSNVEAEPGECPLESAPALIGTPPMPCPELLTEAEAIRYLRLDTITGLKNPGQTLVRYRAAGLLRGTQVSKSVFYRRVELDRFLDRLTNENPR